MNKLLLTGSGGFIGANLRDYFSSKNFEIVCPRSFECNLADKSAVDALFAENKDVYAVIHCANIGGVRNVQDDADTLEKNTAMILNLLENTKGKTPLIAFGSGAQYGKQRSLNKVSESEIGDIMPKDLYGLSKLKTAKIAAENENMLCLNIFGCYGKHEKPTRFPTYALNCAAQNKDICIERNSLFDYLYIEDLCKIIEAFLHDFPFATGSVNATPDISDTMFEIANCAIKIANSRAKAVLMPQSETPPAYTGSNAKLKNLLPNLEFTPMQTGLKKLYEYLQKNGRQF